MNGLIMYIVVCWIMPAIFYYVFIHSKYLDNRPVTKDFLSGLFFPFMLWGYLGFNLAAGFYDEILKPLIKEWKGE